MRLLELALFNVEEEAILFEDGEYFAYYPLMARYMFFVCLSISLAGVHGHVVHIDGEVPTGY